jgi:hypothetical protein
MRISAKRVKVPPLKKEIVRQRSAVFPIAIPEIPASLFPITSQEDLVNKITRLFLTSPKKTRPRGGPLPPSVTKGEYSGEQTGDE